jgi:hypothetical protein
VRLPGPTACSTCTMHTGGGGGEGRRTSAETQRRVARTRTLVQAAKARFGLPSASGSMNVPCRNASDNPGARRAEARCAGSRVGDTSRVNADSHVGAALPTLTQTVPGHGHADRKPRLGRAGRTRAGGPDRATPGARRAAPGRCAQGGATLGHIVPCQEHRVPRRAASGCTGKGECEGGHATPGELRSRARPRASRAWASRRALAVRHKTWGGGGWGERRKGRAHHGDEDGASERLRGIGTVPGGWAMGRREGSVERRGRERMEPRHQAKWRRWARAGPPGSGGGG